MSGRFTFKPIAIGTVFGRLTVTCEGEPSPRPKGGHHGTSICQCECGTTKLVMNSDLRRGATRSCGCLRIDVLTTHGQSSGVNRTRTYIVWCGMKSRCMNESHPYYKDYGGRGITVCERWGGSYEHFLADMGECPSTNHSIDRFPDNNGPYAPGNCRWATQKEQTRNTRRNVLVDYDGDECCVAEYCERHGISPNLVNLRMQRGWSRERAITQPARHYNKKGNP